MAVMETKIMQVENSEDVLNETNEVMACFGWNVMNVQVTHSQNTKTYSSAWDQMGGNESQTVETTTINYATITYQRNKGILNYAQIVALEKEFDETVNDLKFARNRAVANDDIGCFAYIFWPLLIYKLYCKTKSSKLWGEVRRTEEKRDEILRQAEALLD